MEANKLSEAGAAPWKYLPDTIILCQYLNTNEFIELSKSNKRYRKQSEKIIFKNLSLTSWLRNNDEISGQLRHTRNYDELLDILKRELGNNLKLVRSFTFKEVFSLEVASEIINLLPNLTRINFSTGYDERKKFDLLELISKIQNLEHIEYSASDNDDSVLSYCHAVFPKSLRSIKIHVREFYWGKVSVFDNVDSSFINLKFIDIPSNKMLKNLSSTPNLKEVKILQRGDIKEDSLVEFFKINPQITKLEMEHRPENDELLQTIISSKFLRYFGIDGTYYYSPQCDSYPLNYSIKNLIIGSGINQSIAIQLINACKASEYVEFNCWHLYAIKNIEWDNLTQRVSFLGFRFCELKSAYIRTLDRLKFFDRLNIQQCYGSQEINDFNFGNLKNYSKLPFTSEERNHCIVKKNY
jgi:hypothetical protein